MIACSWLEIKYSRLEARGLIRGWLPDSGVVARAVYAHCNSLRAVRPHTRAQHTRPLLHLRSHITCPTPLPTLAYTHCNSLRLSNSRKAARPAPPRPPRPGRAGPGLACLMTITLTSVVCMFIHG